MNLELAKKELVKRYEYLYINAPFILAPYMYEQTEDDYIRMKNKFLKAYNMDSDIKALLDKQDNPAIYLKIYKSDKINALIEEFLLTDKPLEESNLYKELESKRTDKVYLDKVKKGLELVAKKNANYSFCKTHLDIEKILTIVTDYINGQTRDSKNKKRKIKVINEYQKIAEYKNEEDFSENNYREVSIVMSKNQVKKTMHTKNDFGVKSNHFILTIAKAPVGEDNNSIFTENEKQAIYLKYHDELPWNLEIACQLEEKYPDLSNEARMIRPDNTQPCGDIFYIKEEEVFVNPSKTTYRYYQLCPHCGYMVNIPKEILSEGIKRRIEDRCNKDDKLLRKKYLYSELFSLEKSSPKKSLKKDKK